MFCTICIIQSQSLLSSDQAVKLHICPTNINLRSEAEVTDAVFGEFLVWSVSHLLT